MFITHFKKLLNSITNNGLRLTIKKLFSFIKYNYIYHLDDKIFDLIHKVETTEKEDKSTLSVPNYYKSKVVPYEAMKSKNFYSVMNTLNIESENYIFIDVGSGKGKVLLLASKYPFQKIIGVELSHSLIEKSKENIRSFRPRNASLRRITTINKDILEFNPPKGNLIFFLYNPFNAEIMTSFVSKIESLIKTKKTMLIIVYFNPVHIEILRNCQQLQPITITDKFVTFSSLK